MRVFYDFIIVALFLLWFIFVIWAWIFIRMETWTWKRSRSRIRIRAAVFLVWSRRWRRIRWWWLWRWIWTRASEECLFLFNYRFLLLILLFTIFVFILFIFSFLRWISMSKEISDENNMRSISDEINILGIFMIFILFIFVSVWCIPNERLGEIIMDCLFAVEITFENTFCIFADENMSWWNCFMFISEALKCPSQFLLEFVFSN